MNYVCILYYLAIRDIFKVRCQGQRYSFKSSLYKNIINPFSFLFFIFLENR